MTGLPIVDGSWDISASFAPALLEKGVLSTRRVLVNWWKDGVTDQGLAARKQGPVRGYLVGLSTAAGMAATILTDAQRGYDVSWLDPALREPHPVLTYSDARACRRRSIG